MNTTKMVSRLGVVALALCGAMAAVAACSSDNSTNPGPTPFDSGSTNDSSQPNNNPDTGPITQPEAGPGIDANLPDVGSCTSDASTCNSCYTPQQDPLNGCSPATVNCIPFDNTRVPSGAP